MALLKTSQTLQRSEGKNNLSLAGRLENTRELVLVLVVAGVAVAWRGALREATKQKLS